MMVGKQCVKARYMYRWAGEASTQVKEASSNKGYEADSNAFKHISLQKQVARAENNVCTCKSWRNINLHTDHSGGGLHGWVVPNQMHGVAKWSWRDNKQYGQVTVILAANIIPKVLDGWKTKSLVNKRSI